MNKANDLIPLNAERIMDALQSLGKHSLLTIHVLESVDSTNQFLKNSQASSVNPILCIAETQTAGRGRFNRTWHSPYGQNIYCSIRQILPVTFTKLSALSLVLSIAVVKTIQALGLSSAELRIKWPNDLLWQGKKLSGILIESVHLGPDSTDLIMGIGLNVNTVNAPPWSSLREIAGFPFDRNLVLAELIIQIQTAIDSYITHGFASFMPLWTELDYLYLQNIQVNQHNTLIRGQALGITLHGHLIVIDDNSQRHELCVGDASLSL